jgi:hypothetical protein
MARTATTEKMKTGPLSMQADQSAPTPKTADELHAEVMRLEAELEAAPTRIQQLRAIAQDSLDDAKMTDALLTAKEIEEVTVPMLKIKLWNAKRSHLQASLAETKSLEEKLGGEVAREREDLSRAEQGLKVATEQRVAIERRFKIAADQFRGATMRAQQISGDLQRHEREKPQL